MAEKLNLNLGITDGDSNPSFKIIRTDINDIIDLIKAYSLEPKIEEKLIKIALTYPSLELFKEQLPKKISRMRKRK